MRENATLDRAARPMHADRLSPNPGVASMVESRPGRDIGRVFVGRQQEMAELTAALGDALSGQGRLVMLAGE